MKLRELLHKAGGVNSPVMEYEVRIIAAGKAIQIYNIETHFNDKIISIEIPFHEIRFVYNEIEGNCK